MFLGGNVPPWAGGAEGDGSPPAANCGIRAVRPLRYSGLRQALREKKRKSLRNHEISASTGRTPAPDNRKNSPNHSLTSRHLHTRSNKKVLPRDLFVPDNPFGGLVANVALARKLAELFWRLIVHGRAYVEQGLKKYEEKVARTEQRLLQKLARKYNLVLQPKAP